MSASPPPRRRRLIAAGAAAFITLLWLGGCGDSSEEARAVTAAAPAPTPEAGTSPEEAPPQPPPEQVALDPLVAEPAEPADLAYAAHIDADIAEIVDRSGLTGAPALLVELEGRWLCEVQQVAVADLSEQDELLARRLAAAGATRAGYDAFKSDLAGSPELRGVVLEVFTAACPSTVPVGGQDIPAE